jgi:nitrilase
MRAGIQSLERSDPRALDLIDSIPAGEEDLMLRGGSAVIAPNAAYLSGPVFDKACILFAELDLGLRHEGHLTLDTSGHYSRPDVFRLEIKTNPQEGVSFQAG